MGKKILSYCRITDDKVILNGNLVLSNNNSDLNHWITDIYNYTKLSYRDLPFSSLMKKKQDQ